MQARLTLLICLFHPALSWGTGFDFSKCQGDLAKAAARYVPHTANMVTDPSQVPEMSRRLARYEKIRTDAKETGRHATSLVELSRLVSEAFESALAVRATASEADQVAFAREAVDQMLRKGLQMIEREAPGPEVTAAIAEMKMLLGPIEKIDRVQLSQLTQASVTALGLSELRRNFVKHLISGASLDGEIKDASDISKAHALKFAEEYVATLAGHDKIKTALTDSSLKIPLLQALETAEALAEDSRVPEFHRNEITANLKFFREFGIPPNALFLIYIDSLSGVVRRARQQN